MIPKVERAAKAERAESQPPCRWLTIADAACAGTTIPAVAAVMPSGVGLGIGSIQPSSEDAAQRMIFRG
jgi:hypothetical protein